MNGVETLAAAPKRSRRRLWFVLAGLALAFVALVGACASYVSWQLDHFDLKFDFNRTPGIYKPIPVATAACPYLRRVHDTAGRAGELWVAATFGDFAHVKRGDVKLALADFSVALRRATPHVPNAVRQQLVVTVRQVQVGERDVLKARTMQDYGMATMSAITAGNDALGNASDLVGKACGFRLEPRIDYNRAVEPRTTSVTFR